MIMLAIVVVVAIVVSLGYFGYKHLKTIYQQQSVLLNRIVFLETIQQQQQEQQEQQEQEREPDIPFHSNVKTPVKVPSFEKETTSDSNSQKEPEEIQVPPKPEDVHTPEVSDEEKEAIKKNI